MKIALACDHGGINLKTAIKKHLEKLNHEVLDFGTNSTDSVDYPDFAKKAADAVASKEADCGILVCGTGIGIGISANRSDENKSRDGPGVKCWETVSKPSAWKRRGA